MAKTIASYVSMLHYGEYERWKRGSKELPTIKQITEHIHTLLDVEFGYTLLIKQQKGKTISFYIEHPPFLDENGKVTPRFEGKLIIPQNTYKFYLGDCIWEPITDKSGEWRLITYIDNELVAEKTLFLIDTNSTEFDIDW